MQSIPAPTAHKAMEYSDPFGGSAWTITGAVTEANAILDSKPVLEPWPRWQFSYSFAGGTTQTATLKLMWKNESGVWQKLGALAAKGSFAAADIESQLSDIIAPAGATDVAVAVDDYTDGTITATVRGVA